MRIGDKVRLLRGTEEGYIVSIKGNIVDIEIEDGFTIPAVKNEVVVVDQGEKDAFNLSPEEESSSEKAKKHTVIPDGVFLGLNNDEDLECFIFNQTPDTILFSISIIDKKNATGFASGVCKSYEIAATGRTEVNPQKKAVRFLLQVIFHEISPKIKRAPMEIEITVIPSELGKMVFIPSIEKSVNLIPIQEEASEKPDPILIRERLIEGSGKAQIKERSWAGKPQLVDLHMDAAKLGIPENEILSHQLSLFENAYDRALLQDADHLKVIHGVGSGILRREIHKRISKRSEVKYFEDSDKEKFGYGATMIYF